MKKIQIKIMEVGTLMPDCNNNICTMVDTPINPAGNKEASSIKICMAKDISAEDPTTHANVVKFRLVKIVFILLILLDDLFLPHHSRFPYKKE